MKLKKLRKQVVAANVELVSRRLVLYTFGNASGIDRKRGIVAIKPSGVPFEELEPEHIVLTDLDGNVIDGSLRPSSDLPTHVELYKAFPDLGGIVHTHSTYASAYAQAGREIPCLGTTHADYWYGPVPVTNPMPEADIRGDYEKNTGTAIIRRFEGIPATDRPGVLVHGHGPFTWGASPAKAVFNAVILEELARMTYISLTLNPEASPLPQVHLDKHFLRKHGPNATYGQKK